MRPARGLVVAEVDEPPRRRVRPEPGETLGLVLAVTFLVVLVVAMVAAGTGTIDDLFLFVLGGELVGTLLAWGGVGCLLAAAVWFRRWSSDATAYRIGSVSLHADSQAEAAIHEGYGHAAVAHGVGVRVRSAEANPNGRGVTRLDPGDIRRATPAQRLAIARSGEVAAGPVGCKSDRKNYARELRSIPRGERAAAEAEAARLCAVHVGSSFGQRVTRALERNGRWH